LETFHKKGRPEDFIDQHFDLVFGFDNPLADFYNQLLVDHTPFAVKDIMWDTKTFRTNAVYVKDVGYAIIMHDVTPFIEVDRLKNELVSTVSHDLKNPLSVMKGYTELVVMTQELNERGANYVSRIRNAIDGMQ